jgi:hypothetical protein
MTTYANAIIIGDNVFANYKTSDGKVFPGVIMMSKHLAQYNNIDINNIPKYDFGKKNNKEIIQKVCYGSIPLREVVRHNKK